MSKPVLVNVIRWHRWAIRKLENKLHWEPSERWDPWRKQRLAELRAAVQHIEETAKTRKGKQ